MSNFVETWKGIADAMGRSERWCRYMARRSENPLPVYKMGGIVRMNHEDRETWLVAERNRPQLPIVQPVASEPVVLRLIA